MKDSTREDYRSRLLKLQRFIEKRLDQPLGLKELADIACFSEYHLHRIFTAFTGESLQAYIRRLRLENAANRLCLEERDITDIAFDAGYQTPASFSKAFKREFGQTPSEFRRTGILTYKETSLTFINNSLFMEAIMTPEIKTISPIRVLCVRRTGPYQESAARAWAELCSFAGPKGLLREETKYIGLSHDNPDITDGDKLRFDACISYEGEEFSSDKVFTQIIEGGTYAVFTHKGPYEQLNKTYHVIFGQWLPESGRELKDSCGFEQYLNTPEEVQPEDLLTQIYIPLK